MSYIDVLNGLPSAANGLTTTHTQALADLHAQKNRGAVHFPLFVKLYPNAVILLKNETQLSATGQKIQDHS